MSKCGKVEQPNACGHTTIQYTYCNSGAHINEYYANKACHERPGLPPPTTLHAGQHPWCGDYCQAKLAGWLCCQCPLIRDPGTGVNQRQPVTGYENGNKLFHYPVNGQ